MSHSEAQRRVTGFPFSSMLCSDTHFQLKSVWTLAVFATKLSVYCHFDTCLANSSQAFVTMFSVGQGLKSILGIVFMTKTSTRLFNIVWCCVMCLCSDACSVLVPLKLPSLTICISLCWSAYWLRYQLSWLQNPLLSKIPQRLVFSPFHYFTSRLNVKKLHV